MSTKVKTIYSLSTLTSEEILFFNDFPKVRDSLSVFYQARDHRIIYKTTYNGKTYFIKFFKCKNFLDRLGQGLGVKKAIATKNFEKCERLRAVSFDIIEPIFIGSFSQGSFSVTYDCLDLGYSFSEDRYFKFKRSQLDGFINLLNNYIYFSDYNIGNFLLKDEKIYLLDIDDVRIFDTYNKEKRNEAISKFFLRDDLYDGVAYSATEVLHYIWDNITNNTKDDYLKLKDLMSKKRVNAYKAINWRY